MQKAIDKIKEKVQSGELFHVRYKSTPIDYEMNEIKSINIEEVEGWALRIIHEGKIGFSSSTSPDQIEHMIDKAIEVAQFGQEAHFDFPEQIISYDKKEWKLYDPSIEARPVKKMIETGNSIIRKVHSAYPDLRCDVGIAKQSGDIKYYNTHGGAFDYQKTLLSYSAMVQKTTENDMMMLSESQQWGKANLSIDSLWEEMERKIKWSEKIVPIKSGNMSAIFTPKALLVLLLPLISGLNGRLVNKKMSPLEGKKGQLLWSPLFSLYSDGTIDYAAASAPYDDEGIFMRRLALAEEGVLKNYYYDLQNAAEAGVEPTGNGMRSGLYASPSPGVSNLIVTEGETPYVQMIKDIKEGIIIDQVLGLGQGNVLSGSFSNNVQLGFKIENGKVVGRIKNVMISGNAFEVLKNITSVSSDPRWISGQYYFPHICIKSLSVSTKP